MNCTQNVLKRKNKSPKIRYLCGFRGLFYLFPLFCGGLSRRDFACFSALVFIYIIRNISVGSACGFFCYAFVTLPGFGINPFSGEILCHGFLVEVRAAVCRSAALCVFLHIFVDNFERLYRRVDGDWHSPASTFQRSSVCHVGLLSLSPLVYIVSRRWFFFNLFLDYRVSRETFSKFEIVSAKKIKVLLCNAPAGWLLRVPPVPAELLRCRIWLPVLILGMGFHLRRCLLRSPSGSPAR